MKYRFEHIENGQITEGYTTLQITDREAEVDPADAEAILLAEKRGGELVTQQGEPPKDPAKYKARLKAQAEPGFSMEIKTGEATGLPRVGVEAKLGETVTLTDEGSTD